MTSVNIVRLSASQFHQLIAHLISREKMPDGQPGGSKDQKGEAGGKKDNTNNTPPGKPKGTVWDDDVSSTEEYYELARLELCTKADWGRNRDNPIEVAKWVEKIATAILSALRNWWIEEDDGGPQPLILFELLMECGGYKRLKLTAQELARTFAQSGRLEFKIKDLVTKILQPVASTLDDYDTAATVIRLAGAEELKKKEASPPSYEELFGAAGGGEETKNIEEEEEEEEIKKKKKKKKKNKNNQKERLRMKKEEKDQLEEKVQEEKKGWNGPCGNIFCNENAKHRCNKCKKIGFCSQGCFEKSAHPGRCPGRNEK